jgi:hypothetical protein
MGAEPGNGAGRRGALRAVFEGSPKWCTRLPEVNSTD